MKNLLEYWEDLAKARYGKNIILFLDYDGTLSPIAFTPEQALLSEENKELLQRLVKIPTFQVVVVSGRMLSDLKQIIAVEGVLCIGNHGWEIEGSSTNFQSLIPVQVSSAMGKIKYELKEQLAGIQGVFMEDKGATLSVHYRLAPQQQEAQVKKIFGRTCLPYCQQKLIKVQQGKKVFEIRPPVAWDKGKAALWLIRKQEIVHGKRNVLAIYVGDDTSDSDAFHALKDTGITVFVGTAPSSGAQYYLSGPEEVTEFLKHMIYGAYEKL